MSSEAREKAMQHMRRQYSKTAEVAAEHGWAISYELDSGEFEDRLDLKVERGSEIIKIWWQAGGLKVSPDYEFAGTTTKLRNHSAMLQQMASKPDPKATQRRLRKSKGSRDITELIKGLPWDPEVMDDKEILRECYGRALTWKNGITGQPEIDHVVLGRFGPESGPNWNAMNYKISRSSAGRRILKFVGTSGYRAVGLDALLRVG